MKHQIEKINCKIDMLDNTIQHEISSLAPYAKGITNDSLAKIKFISHELGEQFIELTESERGHIAAAMHQIQAMIYERCELSLRIAQKSNGEVK